MSEQEILQLIKRDKQEFSKLYELFKEEVYRFSFAIVQNRHDAEDLTAKAFLELYKNIESYEWKGISTKFWLFKAVKNFANEHFRKVKNEEHYSNILDLEDQNISFVEEIIQKDLLGKVYKEVAKFDALERAVINLRIHEGLSYKEIGEILNLSAEASRKRFDRSIQALRQIFDKKLATLPLLYTAISQAIKQNMPKSTLSPNFSSLENAGNTIKNFLQNPILDKIIPVAFTGLLIIGAGTAFVVSTNNQNNSNNQANQNQVAQVTNTPTPEPTIEQTPSPTDTPTQSPTSTPTPTAAATQPPIVYKTFTDTAKGITFRYPSSFTVSANALKYWTITIKSGTEYIDITSIDPVTTMGSSVPYPANHFISPCTVPVLKLSNGNGFSRFRLTSPSSTMNVIYGVKSIPCKDSSGIASGLPLYEIGIIRARGNISAKNYTLFDQVLASIKKL